MEQPQLSLLRQDRTSVVKTFDFLVWNLQRESYKIERYQSLGGAIKQSVCPLQQRRKRRRSCSKLAQPPTRLTGLTRLNRGREARLLLKLLVSPLVIYLHRNKNSYRTFSIRLFWEDVVTAHDWPFTNALSVNIADTNASLR